MSTKMLPIWGAALPNVTTILYSPFQDFINLRMRSTRSIRRIRKNESLTPEPAKTAVITISTIDIVTMEPSSWFHPSAQ